MHSGQFPPTFATYILAGVIAAGCGFLLIMYVRHRSSRPSVEKWLPPPAGSSTTGDSKITPVRPVYRHASTIPELPSGSLPGNGLGSRRREPQNPPVATVTPAAPVLAAAHPLPRPPGQLYQDKYAGNAVPHDPWQALYSSMAARGQTKPDDDIPPRHV